MMLDNSEGTMTPNNSTESVLVKKEDGKPLFNFAQFHVQILF